MSVERDDAARLDRVLCGLDAGALNAAALSWRGLLATGVIYYGQGGGGGGGAAEIERLGREVSAPHGWRDPAADAPAAPPDAAWRAAYAALTGPAAGRRRALSRAVALAPGRPAFLVLRGLCGLVARNGLEVALSGAARADLEAAHAAETRSHWAPLALGLAEYLGKRMRAARELFEEAARRAPRRAWPVALAADALFYNSSFAEAETRFQDAVRLDPRCAWAWALLGRARYQLGDPRMLAALDRAVALEPRSGWIRTWRGAAHALRGASARARRDFAAGARLMPAYDRAQAWYGAWLCGRGGTAEGLRRLRRAAALNPSYEVTWYALATALAKTGRFAASRRAMERALALNLEMTWVRGWTDTQDPDPACRRVLEDLRALTARATRWGAGAAWLGQTALLLRRHDEARPALEAARRARALGPWPSVWLGLLERRLGRAEEALRLFREAAGRASRPAWALAGQGACLLDLGRPAQAERALDAALRLDPRVGRGLGALWRAQARAALGRRADAERDAADALAWYPHWGHWLKPLLKGARRPFSRVADGPPVEGEPDSYDAPAWIRRGRARLAAGDAAGARADFSRVLEECLDPLNAEALALRAAARQALGEAEGARRDFARALALAPELARLAEGA